MSIQRREFLAAAGAVLAPAAFAQSPLESMRLFVGFPAGTTPDVLARKVGERLGRSFARATVVENRVGAGGQLAVTAMKGAPADGSHLLLTPMSMLGVYPHTYKKLPYDPVADLTPVTMGVSLDTAIGVGPAVPESVRTVPDLMAWYKANPARANMASPATGSTLHFTAVILGRASGVEVTHVGYKGSGPAITDMLGGTMPALCAPLGTFLSQPKIRLIGTSGAKRSRFTPNVSTFTEQGYKDMAFDEWYGFFLPAKAPADVVKRLNAALHDALAQKDIIDTLATFGMEATPSTAEQLAAAQQRDLQRWGPIVKSIGFTADS